MPGSGGGLEIALNQIGTAVHLLPITLKPEEVLPVLRKAIASPCTPLPMSTYSARSVAQAYLDIDAAAAPTPRKAVLTRSGR